MLGQLAGAAGFCVILLCALFQIHCAPLAWGRPSTGRKAGNQRDGRLHGNARDRAARVR